MLVWHPDIKLLGCDMRLDVSHTETCIQTFVWSYMLKSMSEIITDWTVQCSYFTHMECALTECVGL